MAVRLGKFFKNLFSTDTTEGAAEAAKATFELADKLQNKDIQKLVPLVQQGGSLLEVLNSPLAELMESTLPFVKVATGLLKFYLKVTKKEPTIAQTVALVSQAAYLESFEQTLLALPPNTREQLKRRGNKPASAVVKQQLQHLDDLELSDKEARRSLLFFPESELAKAFNPILTARLVESGAKPEAASKFVERVAASTHAYIEQALEEMGGEAQQVREWYRGKSREEFEKRLSLEEYLDKEIRGKPDETIFDEPEITFRDLYVPLKVRLLDDKGDPIPDAEPVDLETWVNSRLNEPKQQVLFIQGEAGRGKSVFCRMFGDRLSRDAMSKFVPVLIRLRHLLVLENNLTQTLENYLQGWDFVTSDPGWLTDKNTRFLFLLDGFDELLLEGRASGGLKEFLQQVEAFQNNSSHRFLVTGRPLALQGIDRLIDQTKCLNRVELLSMDDPLQQVWLSKWALKVGEPEANQFQAFLKACPKDVRYNLAREPLLLYLLARLHREGQLSMQLFAQAAGIQAKLCIYDQSVKWVLEKQRDRENFRLTGLEAEELRQVLTEAALCVVQSGNEIARVSMVESRLSNHPMASLIQSARQETAMDGDRALNTLLTTFYLKPASGDKGGSIEFAHKSFSEFLFAERLKEAIEDWSKVGDRRKEYYIPTEQMHWEVYDLLGYGGLTPEIVGYLTPMLVENSEICSERENIVRLFERLQDFYDRWCEGEFIDTLAPKENWPQKKIGLLREQLGETKTQLGLRQVDVYAGLNIMILLLELHRYAKSRDDLQDAIDFKLCSPNYSERQKDPQLLQIIGYAHCISDVAFTEIVGRFLQNAVIGEARLSGANLSDANLSGANLSDANLSGANLSGASLSGANLSGASLSGANLSGASLSGANLSGASLSGANLSGANLSGANLSGASLSGTYLRIADLSSADLSDAYLRGADLSSTNLSSANLHCASLSGADLSSADLHCADLSNADLSSADLSNANLSDADLNGANLEHITWDKNTKWDGAKNLKTVVNMPEELKQQLGLVEKAGE
jgi:uncharacterized protein YjbI with pentapeptide repeats